MNKPIELTPEMTEQEKIAAQNVNNCMMTLDIKDYPIEHGKDGIWTWKKYASGDAECWGVTQVNSAKDDGQSISPATDFNLPFDLKTINYASANAFNNSWKLERTYVKLLGASPHKQIRAVCYTLEYIPTATDQFVSIDIKGSWK